MKERLSEQDRDEFLALSRQLIKWLCDNCHPHVKIIITPTNAELLEGLVGSGEITEYLKD